VGVKIWECDKDIYGTNKRTHMKNIKLFEQYAEDYQTEMEIADSIYEDWKADQEEDLNSIFENDLYEDDEDWGDDDEELTSGEKAALARDFQIMSKPQLAALYLRALGKVKDNHYGAYTIMIDGIKDFGEIDKEGVFNITGPAFADAIGLDSAVTVQRTIKKFRNLISGEGETSGEAIYPKIIKAFNEFNSRTPREIAALASEVIQDNATFTKNRDAAAAEGPRASAKRFEQKINQIRLGEKVHSLINSLKAVAIYKNDTAKAQRAAISRLSRDLNVMPEKIQLAYQKFLKDKGIK
jgi:hypothetical protein